MPTATITAKYSIKIIKAGALLADTKTLLAYWDIALSVEQNLDRFQRENLFGKASRSRIEDILAIFKQRYLRDPELLQALVVFAQAGFPAGSFDRILYFLALQSDPLLHDAVTDLVKPVYDRGQPELSIGEMVAWVRQQCDEGRTERAWGDETITRVAQGIMATLRDFGVLQGVVHKRIVPPHLPSPAFSFLALLRYREPRSGDRLVHDSEWQVFFLSELAVERCLIEAHQEHLLEYYAAGRVVRITFPTESLEDYAHTLTQRAY
jgi:hypothetical protein